MTSPASHPSWQRPDSLNAGSSDGPAQPRSTLPAGTKRLASWAVGVVLGIVVLVASIEFVRRQGLDPWTWFANVWVLIASIPAPFVILACTLKAAEVSLNAAAWRTVLRAAYPRGRDWVPADAWGCPGRRRDLRGDPAEARRLRRPRALPGRIPVVEYYGGPGDAGGAGDLLHDSRHRAARRSSESRTPDSASRAGFSTGWRAFLSNGHCWRYR